MRARAFKRLKNRSAQNYMYFFFHVYNRFSDV